MGRKRKRGKSEPLTGEELKKRLGELENERKLDPVVLDRVRNGEYRLFPDGTIRRENGTLVKGSPAIPVRPDGAKAIANRYSPDAVYRWFELAMPEFDRAVKGLLKDLDHPEPKVRDAARKIYFSYTMGSPIARPQLPQEVPIQLYETVEENGDGHQEKVTNRLADIRNRLLIEGEFTTIDRRDDPQSVKDNRVSQHSEHLETAVIDGEAATVPDKPIVIRQEDEDEEHTGKISSAKRKKLSQLRRSKK